MLSFFTTRGSCRPHIKYLWLIVLLVCFSVRFWDVAILIPNVMFLLFLIYKSRKAVKKLQRTNSPIFLAFYGLVSIIIAVFRQTALYHRACGLTAQFIAECTRSVVCLRCRLWRLLASFAVSSL